MANEKSNTALIAVTAAALGGGAYMWWRGRQMKRPPLTGAKAPTTGVIWGPAGPILVRPVNVPNISAATTNTLNDEEKLKLGTKLQFQQSDIKISAVNILKLSSVVNLDYMRSDGLLGKLVAQYYANERSRLYYMNRCGAVWFDDDTPRWKISSKTLSRKSRDAALRETNGYGALVNIDHYRSRWERKKSASNEYGLAYSLEGTFSNWSAPVWFDWAYDVFPYNEKRYRQDDTLKRAGFHKINFSAGVGGFHNYMMECLSANIFQGHNDPEPIGLFNLKPDHSCQYDVYPCVIPKEKYSFGTLPWRQFNDVGYYDRKAATYKLKPILGTLPRTFTAVQKYYTRGYYLVRTVLDILCARGEFAGDFKGFAEHCTWWMIPQPTKDLLVKFDDLSVLGSGPTGFAGISSKTLVGYVMAITPKPGTIPPWEDKGPLWSWPDSTGYMQPITALKPYRERADPNIDAQAQFVLGLCFSACNMVANLVGGAGAIASIVTNALVTAAGTISSWLAKGVNFVLEHLNEILNSDAFKMAKKIIMEVSAIGADLARFVDAKNIVGLIASGSNLPVALDSYLGALTDNVGGSYLKQLENDAKGQIDSLRKSWDWADDLLGSATSMGNTVQDALRSKIRDL